MSREDFRTKDVSLILNRLWEVRTVGKVSRQDLVALIGILSARGAQPQRGELGGLEIILFGAGGSTTSMRSQH